MSDEKFPDIPPSIVALSNYLNSDRAPEGSYRMPELDGFLTGIAVGPEPLPFPEWLTVIFNEQEPVFADEDERHTVEAGILGLYLAVTRALDEPDYQPLFMLLPEGDSWASDWVTAFLEVATLREKVWERLLRSRRHLHLLRPLMVLSDDQEVHAALGIDPADEAIRLEAIEELPAAILGIRDYWHEPAAAVTSPPAPKTGRNDPCPCGSGKKFKKCCGRG